MADLSIIISTNAKQAGSEIKGMAGTLVGAAAQAQAMTKTFEFLDKAMNSGRITSDQYTAATKKLDTAEDALYSAIGKTTTAAKQQSNAFDQSATAAARSTKATKSAAQAAELLANRQRMSGKSTNRFGMYAQQVGYQVGDFAVQVQSGTNALVAFGQQGTQLAGLLPGIYGAILGIGLSVGTAVLKSSGALEGLTFDFKRFKEDAFKFIEPLMPLFRMIGTVLVEAGRVVVDNINFIINSFQYLVAAFRALPEAFRKGVDYISGQFKRMDLMIQSSVFKARSAWQSLKDILTGTTELIKVQDVDEAGNNIEKIISRVEQLDFKAHSLSVQAELLGKNLKETGGAGKVMVDALKGIEKIDIRNLADYFGFGGKKGDGKGSNLSDELTDLQKRIQSIADTMKDSMSNGFMAMVEGTKSVKDAFKDMAREIIKKLYEILVVQQIVGSFDAKTGTGSGIVGAIMGASQADGGAWQGGSQIKAYADGGIVGGPTMFPMAGGKAGLMGEAGPEAIMPLKRGANGKLGVQAEGGGGDNVVVHQNFNFQANGDDSVKRIIAQAAPQIANMTKKSMLDDRRRGGQMKATFG